MAKDDVFIKKCIYVIQDATNKANYYKVNGVVPGRAIAEKQIVVLPLVSAFDGCLFKKKQVYYIDHIEWDYCKEITFVFLNKL